jgi:GNAT superfamily N-acetyltransferase
MDVEWQETYGYSEELGIIWERILIKNPSQLIVWRENNEIIGHVIWHESNTEEHRKGDPRDKEDKEILERLLGEKKSFVELHEIWLTKEHRGKGYGKQFFEFFEEFIKHRGYDSIVYYANHPAAIAICRQLFAEKEYVKVTLARASASFLNFCHLFRISKPSFTSCFRASLLVMLFLFAIALTLSEICLEMSINHTYSFSLPAFLQMFEIAKIMRGRVNMLKTFVYFGFPTFLISLTSPPTLK